MTTTLEPGTEPGLRPDEIASAREYAAWLGDTPGRNELRRILRVGSEKASALRARLLEPDPEPAIAEEPTNEQPAAPEPTPWPLMLPQVTAPAPAVEPVPVPAATPKPDTKGRPSAWPLALLALPAFVAIWSGWVGLGELAGFGIVHPLPGIADAVALNTAITLPIGVESYAAYAIRVWLASRVSQRVRTFAGRSALASLIVGAAGQIAYHLLAAAHVTRAPWEITVLVACLPVAVLGMGSALAHLVRNDEPETVSA